MPIEARDSKPMTTGCCAITDAGPEEIVLNLIHDLRQPLSSIEVIACFLELRLPPELKEAREYVSQLQGLVRDASDCLSGAVKASRLPIRKRISYDFEVPQPVCEDQPVLSETLAGVP